jgi:GNAT superfamily N-acetyltransferase/RimJ/RimL family protein N-acetyltransferase
VGPPVIGWRGTGAAGLAGPVNLERFSPADDEESVRACHEIYLSGLPADDPDGPVMSFRPFAGWMERGWTEDPAETWLARDGAGKPSGWYRLGLPQRENRHVADLTLNVHPARRRAGLGTAMLRHAAARAQHAGRTEMTGMARAGSPGDAFARAVGARSGQTDVRRVLELAAIPPGHLPRLRAAAESASRGYGLLSWAGQTPENLVGALAVINNVAAADMPRDAGYEPQLWDAERVRLDDERKAAQGLRNYTVAARSQASGELAGLTQLAVEPDEPAWGFQELTAVTRAHRGHRLGLLLKVAMLELLAEREPQLARIFTGNTDTNVHMIAINDDLGFRVLSEWPEFEVGIAEVSGPVSD